MSDSACPKCGYPCDWRKSQCPECRIRELENENAKLRDMLKRLIGCSSMTQAYVILREARELLGETT